MREIKRRSDGRIGFRVRVRPSAKKTELLGWSTAGELRITVAAPPRAGEANRALISFLAEWLSLPKEEIVIESGGQSRIKTVSAPASAVETLRELPDI
jgi:uncharacterized protein (TIGR00251 family)